jgi:cyanophycin synthetase
LFSLASNFFLVKSLYHCRRLRALLPRRKDSALEAEMCREAFYQSLWQSAANELGCSFRPMGYGICEIGRDGLTTKVRQNCTAIDDPVTLTIALNKALVNNLVQGAGLPVPPHVVFTLRTLSRALHFLEGAQGDCVVKPASGTGGGQGITTGIRTANQLARAATLAALDGGEMLLEEFIPGDNYRLLYLDGELLDAVQRRPPSVMGDGRSTVRELVDQVNGARLKKGSSISQVQITRDLDMKLTLARRKLSMTSVPAAGQIVSVKTVINQNFGGDNVTVTKELCPSIVADGACAARAVGVRFAGIDIITRDINVPLAESGGVILEVNTTPGFHYHYHKSDGSFPVAVRVLQQLLRDLQAKNALHCVFQEVH